MPWNNSKNDPYSNMSHPDEESGYPMEDIGNQDVTRDQLNPNVGFPIFTSKNISDGAETNNDGKTGDGRFLSPAAQELEKDFDQEFDKDITEHQGRTENIFGGKFQSREHLPDSEMITSDDSSWALDSSIDGNNTTDINNDLTQQPNPRSSGKEFISEGLEPAEPAQPHQDKSESSVFTRVKSALSFLGRENGSGSASQHHTTGNGTSNIAHPLDVLSQAEDAPQDPSLSWSSLSRAADPFNGATSGHGMVANDGFAGNRKRQDDEEAQLGRNGIGSSGLPENYPEGRRSTRFQNSSTSDSLSLQLPSSQSSANEDWINMDKFDDLANLSEFGIDIPEATVNKAVPKKQGITTSLLRLYNQRMRRHSASSSDFVPSDDEESTGYALMGRNKRSAKYGKHVGNKKSRMMKKLAPIRKKNDVRTFTLDTEDTLNLGHEGDRLQQNAEPTIKLPRFGKRQSADNDTNSLDIGDLVSAASTHHNKVKFQRNKKQYRHNRKKHFGREETARITVHIADVLQRQTFILTLCKAFMMYGAPTHRLEEYMSLTARVLETNGSFVYFPGCMLASFGDFTMRTSEMHLVRCAEGLDLGKLDEIHEIYKNVVHDREGVQEATSQLKDIMEKKPRFNAITRILLYAFASAMVAPWGFGGSWIDLPICFGIGGVIGFLQFVICPRSTLYSSLFEVMASIISSFLARAIGSIRGGSLFCYSSIVQSALALILPGYIILCGSLELQSRNLVAGAVRMFYAFIYSLMLSFGITLGAALYGWIDPNATSVTTCTSNINPWWRFLFVPGFTIGIALVNLASWGQLPVMVFVSGAGYVVSYFSSKHFKNETELTATFGCFIIGLVSNAYSRLMKSVSKYLTKSAFMTMSLMLPGIFVQVPSGIASQGSVLVGISAANSIVGSNSTNSTSSQSTSTTYLGSLSFGMVMIEVALGISVGLYLATIVVYPFGKKRTGLFTL
ncbi:hypothetical protein BRETT_004437 [Brettanomyces bruxellensis]|uniref:Threonine/serine exporter-like N-terminal domain-containing protein n=1 Tax=Dekkera bruxellensis TaxID=5007 RepID=A0A871R234_DEKBR|nr:uncharacterized protein BRETT_004437 [Brettanomyces bruxellensis]QOU19216.1 hypothetical protein BRETT_004437 [Brettanomyces bruxellensis]